MLRVFSPEHRSLTMRRVAMVPVLGAAIALGGCSADFLRFDSPVFGLNGDKSAIDATDSVRLADAPKDSTLYDQRVASAPVGSGSGAGDQYTAAPVSGVSRGAPVANNNSYQPKRVARAEPIIDPPKTTTAKPKRDAYAPLTTGALPSRDSIIVQPGDTLYQLSRRYGVSVGAIRQANGLTGNVIRPGQKLVLPGSGAGSSQAAAVPERPAPRYAPNAQYRSPGPSPSRQVISPSENGAYVVRRGDSLYAISRRTGVSVSELKRINRITNVRAIKPGVRLSLGGQVPAARTTVARSVTRPPTRRATRVASRSEIRSKSIKTMPIVRETAPSRRGAYQPRILNQRPDAPIATKPAPIVAILAPTNTAKKFRWPARGRVIAPFNHSGQGTKNDGINIALPLGTDVQSAGSGVVAYAGSELKGYGNLVLVRHDNGWVSAYAHASQVLVKRGDRISRGQVIAKAGRSGGVSQPQLHFELRKGAKPVDPMPHLEQL